MNDLGKHRASMTSTYTLVDTAKSGTQQGGGDPKFIDVDHLLQIARRQYRIVLLFSAIGLLIGFTQLFLATYYYTAGTSILIDDSISRFSGEVSPAPANIEADKKIMSQVAILRSSSLATKVVDKLSLYDDDAFINPPQSLMSRVKSFAKTLTDRFTSQAASDDDGNSLDARKGKAVAALLDNLRVEQQPQSFVIDLFFTSASPDFSAKVANAYADAYLSDKLDANFDASQRATIWLRARLVDLQGRSQEAALRAERYRAEHGLTSTKGALLSEEQLSDISAQYIMAQADSAKALALFNQYKAIVAAGQQKAVDNAATITDQDATSLIATLRTHYLTVTKRAQEIEGKFGTDHPQAVALRKEQDDVGKQIFQELQQMTESYRNQYEVAMSREASLKDGLAKATGQTSAANESLVQLKDLESNADAISDLYKTYLTKYQETAQNQSFPISAARVISAASPPSDASSPKRTLTIAIFVVLGAFAGMGVGLWRETREATVRLGSEVSAMLGVKFLGYLPWIPSSIPPHPANPRDGAADADVMRFASVVGGSKFAETLRHAKIVADGLHNGKESRVIGVVSVLPGEGKSVVAANLAALLASTPARVLLIDADLRRGSLTKGLGLPFHTAWVDTLRGAANWREAIVQDRATTVDLLATSRQTDAYNTSETISGNRMARLLQEARSQYDYIIVDLPPIGPVLDAKAFEPLADAFLLTAEWGVTPRHLLRASLEHDEKIVSKLLGVVLNKVDLQKLATYGGLGSSEQLYLRYAAYYSETNERISKTGAHSVPKRTAV